MARKKSATKKKTTRSYRHDSTETPLRPDVGTQAQFKKKKPPVRYSYDSSLSPAMDWDGTNPARAEAEALIAAVLEAETLESAKAAAEQLKALSEPFLNWSGKAEHLSFDVPTLPLFVHERLSTRAIIDTLRGHKRESKEQLTMDDLFGGTSHDITDQILRAYEFQDKWTNRLILGDSLTIMNSLLQYEGLGGQVQMVYMDPPYGVQFGSNFQPFVRKREVDSNSDDHLSREPEVVQAYRDTWELGLHSYLTYLRDRLLLCRDLLHPTGSVFVQISDANVHHVRELMDEVFGSECHVVTIVVKKKGSQRSNYIDPVNDYILWYSKSPRSGDGPKFHPLFTPRTLNKATLKEFNRVELKGGSEHSLRAVPGPDGKPKDYRSDIDRLFKDHPGARLFRPWPVTNGGTRPNQMDPIELGGKHYKPPTNRCWSHRTRTDDGSVPGMQRLLDEGRLIASGKAIDFKRYLDDFPLKSISNWWDALGGASKPLYVVQTNTEIIKRCMLMTTEPGDLVIDPTCGSGSTAFVAEQWGRRWITTDTSRVPLALARQRLLTATFPWYELKEPSRGPSGGFVYKRKQNSKGQPTGGIVPHITSGTIANGEPPEEEVLVDKPEQDKSVLRVTGPFCVEATIPTPHDWAENGASEGSEPETTQPDLGSTDRLLEALRLSPVLHLQGGKRVELKAVRPPSKTLSLSAEATVVNGEDVPVAFVFGPENGAISERLVYQAAVEAHAKSYTHLYVLGFAIQATARRLVDSAHEVIGVPATYVQATPDLLMGDLLKNMRSSQVFSVCGLPEIKVHRKAKKFQVELVGLDVFDPITMDVDGRSGDDVPAWMLDSDYNGLCFRATQVFFPRTSAWDNLKRALKGTHDAGVWDHLAGTTSAPFERGEHGQVAVKVIDDRGNELMVVEELGA